MVAPSARPLEGKRALVTGGTRGIGHAVAKRLALDGARVVVTGRDRDAGETAATEIGAVFLAAEMLDPSAPERLAEGVRAHLGGLDVLVSNAGGLGEPGGVADVRPEALDATLAVHLKAPWLVTSALKPLMPPGASIIYVASIAGHRVGASSAAYSVAKAALLHLTRCAAAEFGAAGIRVNSVSPGFVPTTIHAQALDADDPRGDKLVAGLARLFRKRQALDRTGTPEDVAALVAFLASDAAAFVTGSDFVADGGMMWGRAGIM